MKIRNDQTLGLLAVFASVSFWPMDAAPSPFRFVSGAIVEESKVLPLPDHSLGWQVGSVVALSGDTLAVGVPADDNDGSRSGSAFVFVRDSSLQEWKLKSELFGRESTPQYAGFGAALALENNMLIVGAPREHSNVSSNAGVVYVFEREGLVKEEWRRTAIIKADDGTYGANFGHRVAIDGGSILVTSPAKQSIYVFERTTPVRGWIETQRVEPGADFVGGLFAGELAVKGSYLVVGNTVDDFPFAREGSAMVFRRSPSGIWNYQAELIPPVVAGSDYLSSVVAVSEGSVLVGQRYDNDQVGAVHVWTEGQLGWTLSARLIPSDGQAGRRFGDSIAVNGTRVAVGDIANEAPGSVYLFDLSGRSREANTLNELSVLRSQVGGVGDQLGSAVVLEPGAVIAGAPSIHARGLDSGCIVVFLGVDDAGGYEGETQLVLANTARLDRFGLPLAISNNVLAAVSPQEDGSLIAPSVSVYRLGGESGPVERMAEIVEPGEVSNRSFGIAVATDGVNLLIGDPRFSELGSDVGAVWLHTREHTLPDDWGQVARLDPPVPAVKSRFGQSVAVDGDLAIVGAPDWSGVGGGSAYVYERQDPLLWIEVAMLTANGESSQFGSAVACSDGTVVVSSSGAIPSTGGNGRVHIFERGEAGQWVDNSSFVIEDPELAQDRAFGSSLDLHGDSLVVGARYYGQFDLPGAALVYRRDGSGVWHEDAVLQAPSEYPVESFGMSVAVHGRWIVVGSPWQSPGRADLFHDDGSWRWMGELVRSDAAESYSFAHFGFSVDLDSGLVAVAAPLDNEVGAKSGAVYLYRPEERVFSDGFESGNELQWSEAVGYQ